MLITFRGGMVSLLIDRLQRRRRSRILIVRGSTVSVAAKKGTKMAAKWSPARGAVRSEPFPLLRSCCPERPGAVKGAPLLGAAKRPLDGEDRSEMIAEEGKAGRTIGERWSAILVPSPAASNNPHLPNQMKHDFLRHSGALAKRRTTGWARPPREDQADLALVSDAYNLSKPKARQALRILKPKQVEDLRESMSRGGF